MNKKEFIEKLKGHGAWCTECHDINGEKDRYVKVAKVRELLEQLDEPQKVKVKQFVAEWYEEHKHNLSESLWEFTADVHEKTLVSGAIYTEFESWFIAQPRVYEFITRMGKGYEVEEEPQWIVCYSTMYLKSPLETGQIESVEITPKKELAYHFKSYKEAKQQTSLIGGAVEKVEV